MASDRILRIGDTPESLMLALQGPSPDHPNHWQQEVSLAGSKPEPVTRPIGDKIVTVITYRGVSLPAAPPTFRRLIEE